MSSFTIGQRSSDHLTIHVLSALNDTGNPYENWVDVEVEIKAGGFSARYGADFLTHDILLLHSELKALYNNLAGTLKFQTLEGQLEFEMVGDGKGHFAVRGVAQDELGGERRLHFSLQLDQTFFPAMLSELEQILQQTDKT